MAHDDTGATRARWKVLLQIEAFLEKPMMVLSLMWLVLVLFELTVGTDPLLTRLGTLIWIIFLFEFALRFLLAPRKLPFLRRNWITLLSLAVPALRLFRAARFLHVLRVGRGVRLVRVLGTFNRSLALFRKAARRRGLGYVLVLSLFVVLFGSAGMYGLERADAATAGGFDSYAAALWWTARIVMTIGPDFWPVTPEGRVLSLLLALYGYATFGYVTAAFASLFVDSDAASKEGEVAGERALRALRDEIAALRAELGRRSG